MGYKWRVSLLVDAKRNAGHISIRIYLIRFKNRLIDHDYVAKYIRQQFYRTERRRVCRVESVCSKNCSLSIADSHIRRLYVSYIRLLASAATNTTERNRSLNAVLFTHSRKKGTQRLDCTICWTCDTVAYKRRSKSQNGFNISWCCWISSVLCRFWLR